MKKDSYPKTKIIEQEYTLQEYFNVPGAKMDETVEDTFLNDENVRYIRIIYKIKDEEGRIRHVSDLYTDVGFENTKKRGDTIQDNLDEKLMYTQEDSQTQDYQVLDSWMVVIYDIEQ